METMNLKSEVSAQIYRLETLHNRFADGEYEEMNALYSEDFQGTLYMPSTGKIEIYNAEQIREGNKEAAKYYQGKQIRFIFSGLTVLSQSEHEAAVSYEITHINEDRIVRAVSIEAWRKEKDGAWRMIRWHEEKGQ